MFQFPSNGKAQTKIDDDNKVYVSAHLFQFPSNGKADRKAVSKNTTARLPTCFNSLQTGKRIASQIYRQACCILIQSFNSLQTGKRIASSNTDPRKNPPSNVSIPFKRESGSQDARMGDKHFYTAPFQFPSNGKADRKSIKTTFCFD